MTLFQTCWSNLYKLCFFPECWNIFRATITHRWTESSNILMDYISNFCLDKELSPQSFWNKVLSWSSFLLKYLSVLSFCIAPILSISLYSFNCLPFIDYHLSRCFISSQARAGPQHYILHQCKLLHISWVSIPPSALQEHFQFCNLRTSSIALIWGTPNPVQFWWWQIEPGAISILELWPGLLSLAPRCWFFSGVTSFSPVGFLSLSGPYFLGSVPERDLIFSSVPGY